jgi:histidyl-tRNA synthetase
MIVAASAGDHAPVREGVQAIALGSEARARLVPIVGALREATSRPTYADWSDRKLTAHFKSADRNNARWAIVLGDDELAKEQIVLRDLITREDRRLALNGSAAEMARTLVEATA